MNTSIITAATTINSNNYCLFIFDFWSLFTVFCFHKPQNAQNYNKIKYSVAKNQNTTVNEGEVVSIPYLICHYLFLMTFIIDDVITYMTWVLEILFFRHSQFLI